MKIFSSLLLCLSVFACATAQKKEKGFFSLSSTQITGAKDYGTLTVTADKHTVVIGTVMAYGENVRGLTVRINNGFAFKLAPAQSGTILNYVGSSLHIVLQPGDTARLGFIDAGKTTGAKHIYISGEVTE